MTRISTEIDDDLLARAKQRFGLRSTSATVELALRLVLGERIAQQDLATLRNRPED